MFEKLLAILPYNPSLVHQLGFYGRRMREEATIRRTGLIFLVLTFMIQFFAVLSPPQPTVADSPNDVLSNGITSATDGFNKCENNTQGFQVILHYYGVSCDAFKSTDVTTLHPHEANAPDYYSMGHIQSGSAGEKSVPICNPDHTSCAGTLYWRHLGIWPDPSEGPNGSKGWKALHLDGTGFYILFDCGNLVSVGIPPESQLPTPPPPAPSTGSTNSAPAVQSAPASSPPASSPPSTPITCPSSQVLISGACVDQCKVNPQLPQCFHPCKYNPLVAVGSVQCFPPCPYNNLIPIDNSACKACPTSSSGQAKDCVAIHKTASNITASIANADGTTASPGDVITYTLYAQNNSKTGIKGYIFQENLNDVMDYADPTDLHGGILSDGIVTWPATYIPVGQTSTVQITVKVKTPIPQTPTSTSDPMHFDLVMTNVYGNAINIKVPGSVTKTIEAATTGTTAALPNTGPGTSLFAAAAIVMIAGYFYGRARLLARESELAIQAASQSQDWEE